jgi:AcrR family transcriptional regulator
MTDRASEAIIEATRASVLDFGIRRTALSDIARRAGVSRMTVYRRYPGAEALLRELMTREFGALMEEIAVEVDGEHARERLVGRLTASIVRLRVHPLFRKVLEAEPELLMPYVLQRMGGTQRHALALIEHDVSEGQADGSVRAGDPRAMAQALLLVTQSFVFSGRIVEGVPDDALIAEFEHLTHSVLHPGH